METSLIRQFNRVHHILPVLKHARRMDDGMVLSAIVFLIRIGLVWRHLPEFYSKRNNIENPSFMKFSCPTDGFYLTGSEVHYSKTASLLLARNRIKRLLAGKAYAADAIRVWLKRRDMETCIPTKSNRKMSPCYDNNLCLKRHAIENTLSSLKD